MNLDTEYIQYLLFNNVKAPTKAFITDINNTLIASTQLNNLDFYTDIGKYVTGSNVPILVEKSDNPDNTNTIYGLPFYDGPTIAGAIVLEGDKEEINKIGTNLKISIEAIFTYSTFLGSTKLENYSSKDSLINLLLDKNFQEEKVLTLMNNLELDSSLMHSVIYIRYSFEKASYFNINLNLGYQSDIENTKAKIKTILKNVKYFNSQDIIGQIGQNGTIIIKSYIPSNNTSEMYLANSKICEEIQQKLSSINSLDFHIASGDAYNNLIDISKSYKEAKEIMEIGRKYNKDERYFSLKSIILEDTYHYLDTHIKNKLIITTLDKLKEVEQETYKQLLSVTESFIDCNFNISKTSQLTQLHRNTINNKLIKFKAITGLDPLNNFSEAFLIKMIAIYDKYNN